jgi:Putative beta-barrel porin-2, OmpL-like. bbp2
VKFVWLPIGSLFLASFLPFQAQASDDTGSVATTLSPSRSQVLLSIHGPARSTGPELTSLPAVSAEKTADRSQSQATALATASTTASGPDSLLAADTGANSTTPDAGAQSPAQPGGTAPPPPPKVPTWQTATPYAPEGEKRRGLEAPLDAVFPGTEWVGQPVIGAPDTDPVWALEAQIYKYCPALKKARIKIYGWGNPGWNYSTSKKSDIPLTYAIVPNHLEMEQLILRIERTPDTVQQEHPDWGFRLSNLFGIDYRWTTAQAWQPASNELLNHNYLYGYDPVECYGQFYIPKIFGKKIFQGLVVRFGRYISPPDIEAQLAPDNYLWTHSIMFTYDAYTHTGIQNSIKINDHWMYQLGIHAGSDMAPWYQASIPTLESYLRWTSKSNNDSLYGGVDGLNNGRYRLARETVEVGEMAQALTTITGHTVTPPAVPGHDNLQQFNLTWGHRFNRRLHMMTEAYYLYSFDALAGGTVSNGAPRPFNELTGPGALLPGTSRAWGFVNYTACKITDHDYITLRPVDYLIDERGWRTGFPTTYASWTIGWCHRFSDYLTIRPEIRYERALSSHDGVPVTPFDNGTRRYQFTLGADLIQRF